MFDVEAIDSAAHLPSVSRWLERRHWLRAFAVAGAVGSDIGAIGAASFLAALARHGDLQLSNALPTLALVLPVYGFACLAFHGYELDVLKNARRSLTRAAAALAIATSVAFAAAFAFQVGDRFSRLEAGYFIAFAVALLIATRLAGRFGLTCCREALEPHVVLLGDGNSGRCLHGIGSQINVSALGWTPAADNPDFLHRLARAVSHADRVVLDFHDDDERARWMEVMRLTGVNAEAIEPQLRSVRPLGIGRWDDQVTLIVSRGPLSLGERVLKRGFDVCVTLLVAPLVVSLVALLAIAIKLESRGPVFFVQQRVGRNNKPYRCYKLRTMKVTESDPAGTRSTLRGDPRITRLGAILRRTSLDELPQLFNVLIGNMSLVGPRPHALGSTAEGELFWNAVRGYWSRHAMKPGLTGLAQVRGFRGATHAREDIEKRVQSDLEYINAWSLGLDIAILARTIAVVFHRNAF